MVKIKFYIVMTAILHIGDILHLVLALATFAKMSAGQRAVYVCKHTNVTGSEFAIVFKYSRDGDTRATGLTSYDASVMANITTPAAGAECRTRILEQDIYTLQYSVDANASLPCGVDQDSMLPTLYKVAILADGTSTLFSFACNISDLQLPNEVAVDSFSTEHLQNIAEIMIDQKPEVTFFATTPDDRPVKTVNVGDYVKLQVYQDRPDIPSKDRTDNFGFVFHTAYPLETDFLIVKIYTLSENSVAVQVSLTVYDEVQELLVNTNKSTPAILNLSFGSYIPRATLTNWTTIDYGLKIQSLGEEIWVIINDNKTSLFIHSDKLLGKQYRLLSRTDARCLIVGIEDNTNVTLDLSNYPTSDLEIDGKNFSHAPEATINIQEFKAVELKCINNCQGLIIKSNKKVAVVIAFKDRFIQIPETNKLYQNFTFHKSASFSTPRNVWFATGNSSVDVEFTHDNMNNILNGTKIATIQTNNHMGAYLSSTGPILAVETETTSSTALVGYSVVVGITQWSNVYYFFMESPNIYTILVTTAEQNFSLISMVTPTSTVRLDTIQSHRITPIPTDLGFSYNDYEATINVGSSSYTAGLYEFTSGETGMPFGIYVLATRDNTNAFVKHVDTIMPVGLNFPCVDQSTGDIVRCEDVTDDESSGDRNALTIGFKPVELFASDTRTFIGGKVRTLLEQGCSTNFEKSAFTAVPSFTRDTNTTNSFVMKTNAFKIFRFRGSSILFFRLKIALCVVETGECDHSCASRTKRSAASNHVDLELLVTDGKEDNTSVKHREPCESTIIYWMPHVLLLMIIIIEVVATFYFLMKKWKLKQS